MRVKWQFDIWKFRELCYENEFYLWGKLLEYMCEDGTSRHHALRVPNNNFICEF